MGEREILSYHWSTAMGVRWGDRGKERGDPDSSPHQRSTDTHPTTPPDPGGSQPVRSSLRSLLRRTNGTQVAPKLAQAKKAHHSLERARREVSRLRPENHEREWLACAAHSLPNLSRQGPSFQLAPPASHLP